QFIDVRKRERPELDRPGVLGQDHRRAVGTKDPEILAVRSIAGERHHPAAAIRDPLVVQKLLNPFAHDSLRGVTASVESLPRMMMDRVKTAPAGMSTPLVTMQSSSRAPAPTFTPSQSTDRLMRAVGSTNGVAPCPSRAVNAIDVSQ